MSLVKLFLARNTSAVGDFFPELGANGSRKFWIPEVFPARKIFINDIPGFPSANGDLFLNIFTLRYLIHKTEKFLFVFADMKETLPRASLAEKGVSFSGTLIDMKESLQTAGK